MFTIHRKQWIKVLKVERDVPRHYRICSKHFKPSDFFPRHQMQKKLMLRPSAVPTENLPPEITDQPYTERPDSPENTSSSFISLDQSDSSTTNGVITSTPIIMSNVVMNNNNNNTIITNNNGHDLPANQDEGKMGEPNFTYHTATPIQPAIATALNFQPSTYETLTTLSTVPYQEINQDPAYTLYDGTEIDRNRLSSVLNKDDYQDGTITYVVNFVDY
ncbi:CLUMA_CG017000, isoform A [Clunio marinus]|uniref:CLUMA_CG017000, isoform A n=1 Tax=Clunio marinus TaxID=568069 RepID=A0A1J1IUD9_9DIPT|nr:CLUMA_CG017000, isoform A [Clunio marinus]